MNHWFKQWRVTFSVLGHHWFIGSSNGVSPALCWVIIGSLVQANGVSPSLYWIIIGSLVQAMECHLLCTESSLVHWFKQWSVTFSVLGHHWFIGSSNGVSPSVYWVIIGSLVQAMECHLLCTGSPLVHWFKQWRVTFCVLGHYWFIGSSNGVSPSLYWVIIGSLVQAMACHLLCTGSSLVHWFKQWRVTFSVLGHLWFIVSSNGVSPALYWVIIGSLFKQWRVTFSVLGHHWFTGSSNGVSPSLYWVIFGSLVQAMACHLLCTGSSLVHCFKQWRVPALYWVIIGSLVQAMACHILFTGSSLIHWFKQLRVTFSVLGHHSFTCSSNGVSPAMNWAITGPLFKQWRVTFSVLGHHWFIGSSNGVSPSLYWVIIGSLVQAMACHLLCTG